jgi:hypothetical protein
MADEPEMIRQEMFATRAALAEKLEALEQHVLGSVQHATCAVDATVANVKDAVEESVATVKDAVADTVCTVKESLDDTVDGVRESLDLELQARRHPWAVMGGAVAAGFIGGLAMSRLAPGTVHYLPSAQAPARVGAASRPTERPGTAPQPEGHSPRSLLSALEPELAKVKGLALGALFNALKTAVEPHVPRNIRPQFTELVDDFTYRLGGRPLEGSLTE